MYVSSYTTHRFAPRFMLAATQVLRRATNTRHVASVAHQRAHTQQQNDHQHTANISTTPKPIESVCRQVKWRSLKPPGLRTIGGGVEEKQIARPVKRSVVSLSQKLPACAHQIRSRTAIIHYSGTGTSCFCSLVGFQVRYSTPASRVWIASLCARHV